MRLAPTGEGGRRRPAVGTLAAALCLAGAAALAGCSDEQPALTLVFDGLPAGTTDIGVTLHAANVTFAAADASTGDVAVTYVGGDVQIAIKAAFSARHADRIRLPLTASQDIPRLEGNAVATGGARSATAQTWTPIAANRSATLAFDFSADAGAGADAPSDSGDGGAPDTPTSVDANGDADASGDAPIDRPADAPAEAPADATAADAPADMPADARVDVPADAPVDVPADAPVDAPPADAPADMTLAPDVSPDAPIPTTCTAVPPRTASTSPGGPPALAATPAGLFGLAWKGSSGDILFNSFTDAGGLQNASDVTAVTAGTSTLGDPQLTWIGAGELVLAYGVRTTTGSAYAAAIKVNPQTGSRTAGVASGAAFSDTTPPIVGAVAVNQSQSQLGIASRRAGGARTQAELVVMSSDLASSGTVKPTALAMTWTAAVAWATSAAKPNRFVLAAILDNTATGGSLLEVPETTLQPGSTASFTRAGDTPLAGGGGATVSAAGLGDAVAVVWVDDHTGVQEVWLSVVDLTSGNRRGAVQVSGGSTLPKQYPKVVFDGAAVAVAWLEIQNGADSRLWLRRFDPAAPAPAPLGTPLAIGTMGTATFGDIGLAAAGPGKYGLAFSRAGSPGTKLFSYVDCR